MQLLQGSLPSFQLLLSLEKNNTQHYLTSFSFLTKLAHLSVELISPSSQCRIFDSRARKKKMYQNLTQRLWNQIPAQFFLSQKTSHKLCAELFSVHPTGTQTSAIPDGQRMIPTRSLLIVKNKLFTQRVKTWHIAPVKKI